MYEVILSSEAEAFYADADRPLATKLMRCFAQLESDPNRHPNIKRLRNDPDGRLRYRVGDWRVLYRVDPSNWRVFVAVIAHRSEVYE